MKTITEIRETPRITVIAEGADGGQGMALLLSSKKPYPAAVVFSWGGGWDHVSVSFSNRCPTWDEMSEIKRIFFRPDECVVQIHPIESEYVNDHPYCLHLWRLQLREFPVPPSWMVGTRKGQSLAEAMKEGAQTLEGAR